MLLVNKSDIFSVSLLGVLLGKAYSELSGYFILTLVLVYLILYV